MTKEGLAVGEPEVLEMLERKKEEAIKQEIESAIAKARELKSDFIGLGEMLYRENPDAWAKVKDDWNTRWLSNVEVDVQITCTIRRTGGTANTVEIR